MLFTLILLTGSLSSHGAPSAFPARATEPPPYLRLVEKISTGILATLEDSADFPIRQYFLCEDPNERDEEREDSQHTKGLLADLSHQQLSSIWAVGSIQGSRLALGSNDSLPLLQSVLLRC